MFAGIGPFSICISRLNPDTEIHAIDLNPAAYDLMVKNIEKNSSKNINPHLGDSKDVCLELSAEDRFQRVIMNLPHHSMDFLPTAVQVIDEGFIHLYSIIPRDERDNMIRSINEVISISGKNVISLSSNELKGYSATTSYFAFDIELN